MAKIKLLPQSIISKIAAGEVIERPAYAVKELVENALDANASLIQIAIEESGLRKIVVVDNGEGMSHEDLGLSFLPHTTSKITREDELVGIKTLGFRGEALSSIAAISYLSIKSRTRDNPAGTLIEIRNGILEKIAPIGTPPGTIVTVENLFHSVPARKKFLKSSKTEFRLLTDIVMRYALSYPSVHFVLTHNKKVILDIPQKETLENRIRLVFGETIFQNLIPIMYKDGYITISGFLGKPQIASKQNQKQYLFINNRFVTDKAISSIIKQAFATLLPASSTPLFHFHITLPHEMVDVNVHPQKVHVTFINETKIFDAVKAATLQTLAKHNLTFNLAQFKQTTSAKTSETQSFSGQLLKETVLPWNRQDSIQLSKKLPVIQIHSTYLFAPTAQGFLLIDQHAAHERILYEQFVTTFEKKKKELYQLEKPVQFHASVLELQLLEEYGDLFRQLGFELEHFQGSSFMIRTVPFIYKGRNIEKIVKDILDDLAIDTGPKTIDSKSQRMLAYLSCRAAIKAGDSVTEKQAVNLVEQLQKTKNNATCPHGRPTQIQMPLSIINTMFRR